MNIGLLFQSEETVSVDLARSDFNSFRLGLAQSEFHGDGQVNFLVCINGFSLSDLLLQAFLPLRMLFIMFILRWLIEHFLAKVLQYVFILHVLRACHPFQGTHRILRIHLIDFQHALKYVIYCHSHFISLYETNV